MKRTKISWFTMFVREELNRYLRDQEPDGEVLEWLNGVPEVKAIRERRSSAAVGAEELKEWRRTGYRTWLIREELGVDRMDRINRMGEKGPGGNAKTQGRKDAGKIDRMTGWESGGRKGTGENAKYQAAGELWRGLPPAGCGGALRPRTETVLELAAGTAALHAGAVAQGRHKFIADAAIFRGEKKACQSYGRIQLCLWLVHNG